MNSKRLSTALVLATLVLLIGIGPSSAAPRADTIHIVQRGETLSAIAVRYGVNMWTLASYNGIANANRIYVGQRLVIPSGTTAQSSGTVHVVRIGETLTSIGLRYGTDAWDIAKANGITNLNHIYVGQRLVIPKRSTTIASASPPPQPTQPTTYPGPWTGEYFDNPSLTAPPYLTRQDANINFNWGWGPPAGGMPTNSFAVRWTGTFQFAEATHRFYAQVDDGVRVYVDGERIIDGWRDGGFRTYSGDRALAAGEHTVQVEYYDRIQVARIHVWWRSLSGITAAPTPTPTPSPGLGPAPSGNWFGEYYNGEGLSGAPILTRYDPAIGFNWGTGSPAPQIWLDQFSVRWTQKVRLQKGTYRLCAWTDDGVRLWAGDTLLINEWHGNNGITYCSPYAAQGGDYEIKVEYYEHKGNALIYVWWEPE